MYRITELINENASHETIMNFFMKQFGLFAHMKEDSPDRKPYLTKYDGSYLKDYVSLGKELKKVSKKRTKKQWANLQKRLDREHEKSIKTYAENIIEKTLLRRKMEDMLSKVESFNASRSGLQEIKALIIKQLKDAIKEDCGNVDFDAEQILSLKKESADSSVKSEIKYIRDRMKDKLKSHNKIKKNEIDRFKFSRQLCDMLGLPAIEIR
jgi:uncharacterized protein YjbJ (UPF0337 family)